MEKILINKFAHLGDTITILILAQNRALKNNWIINVSGPPLTKALFEIFNFKNLHYMEGDIMQQNNCSIINLMPFQDFGPLRKNKANVPFLRLNQFELRNKEHDAEPITKIILPTLKIKQTNKENICCFQFDSRSIHHGKRQLTYQETINTINKFKKNDKPIGIGGKETIKYNNFDYRLGFLNEIAQNLINSNQFIGIDSGISHLAGALKVKSNIILTATIKKHQEELIEFYKLFYPNTTCYTLDDMINFKSFKMI